jgi:hypothetical protein
VGSLCSNNCHKVHLEALERRQGGNLSFELLNKRRWQRHKADSIEDFLIRQLYSVRDPVSPDSDNLLNPLLRVRHENLTMSTPAARACKIHANTGLPSSTGSVLEGELPVVGGRAWICVQEVVEELLRCQRQICTSPESTNLASTGCIPPVSVCSSHLRGNLTLIAAIPTKRLCLSALLTWRCSRGISMLK